jgi:hypothetical protein
MPDMTRRELLHSGLALSASSLVAHSALGPVASALHEMPTAETSTEATRNIRKPQFDYLKCQRHILLDMHVPDWDEGFLAKFDPVRMADLYQRAGAQAVMHYCNSHMGLTYWPTSVGEMNKNLKGRDIVGETVRELHARGMASCAYYSCIFNNWAWTNHPDWRIKAAGSGGMYGPSSRYGTCCFSSQGYQDFMLKQVDELTKTYEFDAIFFDMVFWPSVCVCDNCQKRFRAEAGADIPTKVDWTDPLWSRFAEARKRWLTQSFQEIEATVRRNAEIPLFNNATLIPLGWTFGDSIDEANGQDLLGGDFGVTGGDTSTTCHLLSRVAPNVIQYMNAFTGYIGGASYVISPEEQFVKHALNSLLFNAQFMAIDAVESNGSVNTKFYEEDLPKVFGPMRPYQDLVGVGGKPLADVAIYFSDTSGMSLDENGSPAGGVNPFFSRSPHLTGWAGAMRALQINHIPVGTITKNQLKELSRYRVIVLPSVVRMTEEEVDAFRDYVRGGGKLYASGTTSLLSPNGHKRSDFGLADVFGCSLEAIDHHRVAYVRPQPADFQAAISPRLVVTHGSSMSLGGFGAIPKVTTRVRPAADAEVLATLDLAYSEEPGTREDHKFSSIHASPPYRSTSQPVMLRHKFSDGEAIYAAADIEGDMAPAAGPSFLGDTSDYGPSELFVAAIESLLGPAPLTFRLDADIGVLAVAYDDAAKKRLQLNIANIPPAVPSRPVPKIKIVLRAPRGHRIKRLSSLPDGTELPFRNGANGVVHAELKDLEHFAAIAAEYE